MKSLRDLFIERRVHKGKIADKLEITLPVLSILINYEEKIREAKDLLKKECK